MKSAASAAKSPVEPDHLDSDAARVRQLGSGPRVRREQALRELMDLHAPRLHAVAARTLGDAALAEDVVQETFLKAWDSAASWEPGRARFSTWLHRVTLNRALDHLRRARPLTGVELPDRADPSPLADTAMVEGERRSKAQAAVAALPERQRAAISLYTEGVSQREAAAILDITEGAYESLLVRARRALRTAILETEHGTRHHAL